jgi:shikimate kinase
VGDQMMKSIVLIGMPGCGKSEIGKLISEKMKMSFIDTDSYIMESTKHTISELFEDGEEGFRDVESKAIIELSEKNLAVISTGGGVIKRYENILTLKKNGIIIYINRPIENIAADIDVVVRPLLAKDPFKLYKLLEERGHLYKKYCDHEVMNVSSLDNIVDSIISIYSQTNKLEAGKHL